MTHHGRPWTHMTHHGLDLGEATTFPHIVLCVTPRHLHPNDIFSRDSQGGVRKLSRFGHPGLWKFITPCLDLWFGWSLKQTCSSPKELSKNVSHSTCTHRGQVDSQLLVVQSQIGNLIPDPSFVHNLCYRCLNGSYKAIFVIYTWRPFQRYKKHFKARCFDPSNQTLNFWEPQRTPKSPSRECECHPHTPSKWGCDKCIVKALLVLGRTTGKFRITILTMAQTWGKPPPSA
jgi:hypothetical protein